MRSYETACIHTSTPQLLMDALLSRDTPLAAVPYLADKYLAEFTPRFSHIIGDRAEREPYGPDDLGGAVRILPIALAYRCVCECVRASLYLFFFCDVPRLQLACWVNMLLICWRPLSVAGMELL